MKSVYLAALLLVTSSKTFAEDLKSVRIRYNRIQIAGDEGVYSTFLGMTKEVDKILETMGSETIKCEADLTIHRLNLEFNSSMSGKSVQVVKIWDLKNCSQENQPAR